MGYLVDTGPLLADAKLMPTSPPRLKRRGAKTQAEHKRDHDRRRRQTKPWRQWYQLPIWREIREQQLSAEPFCRRCMATAGRVEPATVVNHLEPHKGDWDRFTNGPFESLCKPCHDGPVQREERRGAVKNF